MEKNEKDSCDIEEDLKEISHIVFNEPNDDKNIQYDYNGRIKLLSFGKLMEKLISAYPSFSKSVLLTYRGFQTPKVLLLALIKRFLTAPEQDRQVVRLRVLSIIKLWITSFWSDFNKDLSLLLPILQRFLEKCSKSDESSIKSLNTVIEGISAKFANQLSLCSNPDPVDYANQTNLQCSILEDADPIQMLDYITPKELAEQLTMYEWSTWSKIQPSELVNLGWTKKNRHETSPNVLKTISIFSTISSWVAMSILVQEDLPHRILRMEYWIWTAQRLMELNNFNTAVAIMSGLFRGPVQRLTNTRKSLSEDCRRILGEIERLCDHKALRDELSNATLPCIPYLDGRSQEVLIRSHPPRSFHKKSRIMYFSMQKNSNFAVNI